MADSEMTRALKEMANRTYADPRQSWSIRSYQERTLSQHHLPSLRAEMIANFKTPRIDPATL